MRHILIATLIFFFLLTSSTVNAKNNTLLGIKLTTLPDNRFRVDFRFKYPLKKPPANFSTQDPIKVVLDFSDTDMQLKKELINKNINYGSIISYNIVSVHQRVRAIFNLSNSLIFSGFVSRNQYTLIFSGQMQMRLKDRKVIVRSNQHEQARFTISKLDFQGADRQGGRLVLDVSDSGIPVEVTERGLDIIAVFKNTHVNANLLKRYDVRDFHSPAKTLTLSQHRREARLVIHSKGHYGQYAYQVNKQFIIDIFPLTPEEEQQEKLKNQVFSGKRITLNFQDIKVRSVIQLLADFTNNNIVVSDRVEGNITLRLNAVPWDQALDIILRTNGLDKRVQGHVIYIDKIEELVRKEKSELETQKLLKTLEPLRSELIQIDYAKAADLASLIKDKNNSVLSKDGSISVDVRTNMLWIQDTTRHIEEIRQLVKKLDIPVKQVQIEARIVDLNKDYEKDLGIRFGFSKPKSLSGTLNAANQFQQGVPPADVTSIGNPPFRALPTYASRLNLDLAATPSEPTVSPASIGIALASLGGGVLLDLELSALESEGFAEIIASPRLITTNQQPAFIEAGEEIPYQESTSSGATAVSFKKAVLSLKVTPQITPDDRILMQLQINQDVPSSQTYQGVPAILTKEIQTTVLVNNGQTIVLGGIYKKEENNTVNRIPFLGGLPVVGLLFRNSVVESRNEELLIFITPRIITNTLAMSAIKGHRHVKIEHLTRREKRKPLNVYK